MTDTALEVARQLPTKLADLHLASNDLKEEFLGKAAQELMHTSESANPTNPKLLKPELEAQQLHGRKLKFRYTEQLGKMRFIKAMVSDEPPTLSTEDNQELEMRNAQKKEALKEVKTNLARTYEEIALCAQKNELDLNRTKAKTDRAAELAKTIAARRLEIARLRNAHPGPRWTIATASATADAQVMELIALQDRKEEVEGQGPGFKQHLVEATKELDRLRVELKKGRILREEEERRSKLSERDDRIPALADWFATSVSLHEAILDIQSVIQHSENELRITFLVGDAGETKTLSLVFFPGNWKLAEAKVIDSDIEIDELVNTHVIRNDVSGLLRAIYSRLQGLRGIQ